MIFVLYTHESIYQHILYYQTTYGQMNQSATPSNFTIITKELKIYYILNRRKDGLTNERLTKEEVVVSEYIVYMR